MQTTNNYNAVRERLLKYRSIIARFPGLAVLNAIINHHYDKSELLFIERTYQRWFEQEAAKERKAHDESL